MNHRVFIVAVALSIAIGAGARGQASGSETRALPATIWKADPAHSSIQFTVQHWGIVNLIGWFDEFEITVYSERPDFSDAVVEAEVRTASIRMPNPAMAGNARKLFGVMAWPIATFRSRSVVKESSGRYVLSGDLSFHGVTVPGSWSVLFTGSVGSTSRGFAASGTIDRLRHSVGDAETLPNDERFFIGQIAQVTCNVRLDLHDWKTVFDE